MITEDMVNEWQIYVSHGMRAFREQLKEAGTETTIEQDALLIYGFTAGWQTALSTLAEAAKSEKEAT